MKVGIKVYSDNIEKLDYIRKYNCFFDFVEVMVIPGSDLEFFKSLKVPIVIHAPHMSTDLICNPADKNLSKQNSYCIGEAIKAADYLNASKIVLHPGHIISETCHRDHSIETILNVNDSRILLENVFATQSEKESFCATPSDFTYLTKNTNTDICFDFAHAFVAAKQKGLDYKKFMTDFIALKPRHYHISGGRIYDTGDSHISLLAGNYPIDFFKSLIPEDAWVTLETPQNIDIQRDEYCFLKR